VCTSEEIKLLSGDGEMNDVILIGIGIFIIGLVLDFLIHDPYNIMDSGFFYLIGLILFSIGVLLQILWGI
jgi:uncharacterized membrane protein YczE